MAENCFRCMRYVIFVFNFFFWLLGMALILLGVWGVFDANMKYLQELLSLNLPDLNFLYLFIILIAIGILMTVIGFMGCCGAYEESMCLLLFYFLAILIITVLQVGCGVLIYLKGGELDPKLSELGRDQLQKYNDSEHIQGIVDAVQQTLICCGMRNFSDYTKYREDFKYYPWSCCKTEDGVTTKKSCKDTNSETFYKEGCKDKLLTMFKDYWFVALAIGILVLIIELIAMSFSLVLCCALRRSDGYEMTDTDQENFM